MSEEQIRNNNLVTDIQNDGEEVKEEIEESKENDMEIGDQENFKNEGEADLGSQSGVLKMLQDLPLILPNLESSSRKGSFSQRKSSINTLGRRSDKMSIGSAQRNVDETIKPSTLSEVTFSLPKIFETDLTTLPAKDKLWTLPGQKSSDYFNYGFREETWNIYRKCIYEYKDKFEEVFTSELKKRKYIFHPCSELNYNIPMDMGGLGQLFNRARYSRVNFNKSENIPVLHAKENEICLRIDQTVPGPPAEELPPHMRGGLFPPGYLPPHLAPRMPMMPMKYPDGGVRGGPQYPHHPHPHYMGMMDPQRMQDPKEQGGWGRGQPLPVYNHNNHGFPHMYPGGAPMLGLQGPMLPHTRNLVGVQGGMAGVPPPPHCDYKGRSHMHRVQGERDRSRSDSKDNGKHRHKSKKKQHKHDKHDKRDKHDKHEKYDKYGKLKHKHRKGEGAIDIAKGDDLIIQKEEKSKKHHKHDKHDKRKHKEHKHKEYKDKDNEKGHKDKEHNKKHKEHKKKDKEKNSKHKKEKKKHSYSTMGDEKKDF